MQKLQVDFEKVKTENDGLKKQNAEIIVSISE